MRVVSEFVIKGVVLDPHKQRFIVKLITNNLGKGLGESDANLLEPLWENIFIFHLQNYYHKSLGSVSSEEIRQALSDHNFIRKINRAACDAVRQKNIRNSFHNLAIITPPATPSIINLKKIVLFFIVIASIRALRYCIDGLIPNLVTLNPSVLGYFSIFIENVNTSPLRRSKPSAKTLASRFKTPAIDFHHSTVREDKQTLFTTIARLTEHQLQLSESCCGALLNFYDHTLLLMLRAHTRNLDKLPTQHQIDGFVKQAIESGSVVNGIITQLQQDDSLDSLTGDKVNERITEGFEMLLRLQSHNRVEHENPVVARLLSCNVAATNPRMQCTLSSSTHR